MERIKQVKTSLKRFLAKYTQKPFDIGDKISFTVFIVFKIYFIAITGLAFGFSQAIATLLFGLATVLWSIRFISAIKAKKCDNGKAEKRRDHISHAVIDYVALDELTTTEFYVYHVIAQINDEFGLSSATISEISRISGISERHLRRILMSLVYRELVRVETAENGRTRLYIAKSVEKAESGKG